VLPDTEVTLQQPQEALDANAVPAARGTSNASRIARAALVLMAGTILSRVLGLGREVTIAHLFGGGADVDAFTIANHVATIVYDLLIAGTVSAALVPTFSEYAEGEKRAELGRVVSTILTVAGLFLLGAIALLELFAAPLAGFMCSGCSPATSDLALTMTQWVLPGVLFMGLSGVVMAAHYALGRFRYPAFTSSVFNAAIIFFAFTLGAALGVKALVVGLVAGAFAMLAMQVPGLRDVRIRPSLDLRHPAVRKIFGLYAPVGLSVVISSAALVIDRSFASQAGVGAISAMRYATTLIQFAMGFVAAAISLAALPTLSQHFSQGDHEAFNRTLAAGIRMVWVMSLPAAGILLALGGPIVSLVFEHGEFTSAEGGLTTLALLFYVIGLPFGAVDQVLIFAFYARKNTLTPVLVGIGAIGVYLVIAFTAVSIGVTEEERMSGLVLANSAQLTFHALVTGWLLFRALRSEGGLARYAIGSTAVRAVFASGLMALVAYVTWRVVRPLLPPGSDLLGETLALGIPVLAGTVVYAVLVWMMRLKEIELIASKVLSRLGRFRGRADIGNNS
jgi:putative peptidoglycan lipid II flippase